MAHPHADSEKSADFLELFFDLIFVYAITQLAAFIHHHPDAAGFLRAAALFAVIWWGWSQFTWTCNGIDSRDPRARIAVLLATVFAFFMAQGLPDAYTSDAEWFSVPFGITLAIGLVLYWWGLRNEAEHQRALVTYLPIAMAAAIVAAATGFLPGELHEWGYGATILLFVVAGIAAGLGTPFHVYARHFAERHSLILIVALGESVIAVGVGSAALDRSSDFALAAGTIIAAVCLFWWSYFAWFQAAMEHQLHEAGPHGRSNLARDAYTFAHAPIVLGIVSIAVAAEAVIAHPTDDLAGYARFAMAAGNAMFLLGMVLAYRRAAATWLTERALAVAGIVLVVALLPGLDALLLGTLVVAIHVVALVAEAIRRPELAR
jgi:low temperature requirement protein LtrA